MVLFPMDICTEKVSLRDCLFPCAYIINLHSLLLSTKTDLLSSSASDFQPRERQDISAKKLITMARKWQKLTNIKRKRITFPQATGGADADSCNASLVAAKGHFLVYTSDQRRFVLTLEYLKEEIFKELFRIAEDEFGLPRYGPITLPCDAASLEYVIAMIQQNIAKNLEKALVIAIATACFPSSSYLPPDLCTPNQQMLICSF
ncbi:hypothetical protein I3760_05G090000 [Carya illinoinensis]|nr:hypothetical protein I3760_05G090000 [Carya illinoinensis]